MYLACIHVAEAQGLPDWPLVPPTAPSGETVTPPSVPDLGGPRATAPGIRVEMRHPHPERGHYTSSERPFFGNLVHQG